jgi:hypothetical protein
MHLLFGRYNAYVQTGYYRVNLPDFVPLKCTINLLVFLWREIYNDVIFALCTIYKTQYDCDKLTCNSFF